MEKMIDAVLEALSQGKCVAVTDAVDREDEADLVIAAQFITEEQMAFMIRHTSGILCVPMTHERLMQLDIPLLSSTHSTRFGTPMAMPVDYLPTSRGGVSAQERVSTVRALIDPKTQPSDFGRPGHVFPLQAHPQGLAGRRGHTEAAIVLMERCGLYPAAVIGELMDDRGKMLRGDVLHDFLEEHHISFCTINDIAT